MTNFIIILGKWFINILRSLNKPSDHNALLRLIKSKIGITILTKSINKIDPNQ